MSAATILGAALALVAAVALNASYLVQHRGGRDAPEISLLHPVRALRGLAASRLWLAGTALGFAGWGLYVAALAFAPLSLAQAFAAGGLALVLPVAARVTGTRLGTRERQALPAMTIALGLLAIGTRDPGSASATVGRIVPILVCCGALAVGLALVRTRRAQLLGVAAGLLYGAADAATKAATGAAEHALLSPASVVWTVVLIGASAGAFFVFQRGLQIGPPLPVVALMSAATSLVAVLSGVVAFGEPLGTTAPLTVLRVGALLAVGLAAWRLAPAQARLADLPVVGPARPAVGAGG